MFILFKSFLAIASAAAFILYSILGYYWLTIGHGLNPWLAFPIALVSLIIFIQACYDLLRDYKYWHLHNTACRNRALRKLESTTINKDADRIHRLTDGF